jgi:hypothetical protein
MNENVFCCGKNELLNHKIGQDHKIEYIFDVAAIPGIALLKLTEPSLTL